MHAVGADESYCATQMGNITGQKQMGSFSSVEKLRQSEIYALQGEKCAILIVALVFNVFLTGSSWAT